MAFDASVHAKAIDLTKLSIDMTTAAGSGHPTTAASLAHLVTVLMYHHMRYNPADPANVTSDRLVLSEGHAVPIVYAAAADLGVHFGADPADLRPMTRDDAMTLREMDSAIDGHPNPVEGFPFFDAATGSLGQGLSVAAGIAAAARLDRLDKRIYCLIGDGESREGQITEALDFIVDHKLTAACPIFNANAYAQSEPISPQQSAKSMIKRLKAIGFAVHLINGHDPSQIAAALEAHGAIAGKSRKPIAIVAETIKGWGAEAMHGDGKHGKPIETDDIPAVFGELDETGRFLGAHWTEGDLRIPPVTAEPPKAKRIKKLPKFSAAMAAAGKQSALDAGKWATRRAYGVALQALGHANPVVVALDADVKNSTFAEDFWKDQKLTKRYFECRIAEQNMVSAAAGLSAGGKIPFASTFAKFFTRAYDQIEMAINSGANIKLVGSHAGVTLAADGPSQMSLPDIAFFRSFATAARANGDPIAYLLQPADAVAAYGLTLQMAAHNGACYMRTHRPDSNFIYDDDTQFPLGGHHVLADGDDLLIITSGYMVHAALDALDDLRRADVNPTIVDLYSIPFDEQAIRDLAAVNGGAVLTIEDNYGGGYGSAVADALTSEGGGATVRQMYARRIPKSGRSTNELLAYIGMSTADIVREARTMASPAVV
ncbi:MAG: transketolase [Planctomycetaceae bacterium]|nr:transketolase [Planctomycetaceae bacterium]